MSLLLALEAGGPQTFIYAGTIATQTTVVATWSFTANPTEAVAAQSGAAAAERAFYNPVEGVAAQAGVAGSWRFMPAPVAGLVAAAAALSGAERVVYAPGAELAAQGGVSAVVVATSAYSGAISATATITADVSFVSGLASYAYAGLIEAQATVSAETSGPPTAPEFTGSSSWRRKRKPKRKAVTFSYAGELYVSAFTVAAVERTTRVPSTRVRSDLALVPRATVSQTRVAPPSFPTADEVIGRWRVAAAVQYRDQIAEVIADEQREEFFEVFA